MKTIQKSTIIILLLVGFQTSLSAQSKCNDDAYAGQEWAGEWDTNFGKVVLAQKGSKVTGTYKDVGKIDAYYNSLTGKLKGTFTNNGNKGSFEYTLTSCQQFTGKWGWGTNLDKGRWTGKRTAIAAKNHNLILTLNGLRALQGGDGKGNPDDYEFSFGVDLRVNNRTRNLRNNSYNFRKKFHENLRDPNMLFSKQSGQIHIEPSYPPIRKDRSTDSKKYQRIQNSGRFTISEKEYQSGNLDLKLDVSLFERTDYKKLPLELLNPVRDPHWLAKDIRVPVNLKLVMGFLMGKKSKREVETSLYEYLPKGGTQTFELIESNGQRKAKGYIVVKVTQRSTDQTYKAGIPFTIALVE